MRLLVLLALLPTGCSFILDGGNICSDQACQAGSSADGGDSGDSLDASSGGILLEGSSSDESGGERDSFTFQHTVADSDRLVLVIACLRSSGAVFSSVTFAGQPMSQAEALTGGDNVRLEVWYLADAPVGTSDVVLESTSARDMAVGAMTFSGVDPLTPIGTSLTDEGSNDTTSITLSGAPGQLAVDAVGQYDSGSLGALVFGSGQAPGFSIVHDGHELRVGASTKPAADSVTMSAEMGGDPDFAHIALTLLPAN